MVGRLIKTILGLICCSIMYTYWRLEQLTTSDMRLQELEPSELQILQQVDQKTTPEYDTADKNITAITQDNIVNLHEYRRDDSKSENGNHVLDPRVHSLKKYFIIVFVHSAINQTKRRDAVRNTWLSHDIINNVSLAYWFLIGGKGANEIDLSQLLNEQKTYKDLLIFLNIGNNYESLTNRSLQSITYISQNYEYTYLIKTDDDVFLNLPIIIQELTELRPRERLYWGRFSCQNPPLEVGRWKEHNWKWCDVYFPYAYGGMYVLTHDVVSLIADNADSLETYSCEDVSLGMWLAPYNLIRVNDIRIFVQHSTRCSRGYIAVHIPHRLSHKVMYKLYENLKRKGILCSTIMREELVLWDNFVKNCEAESLVVI